MPGVWHPQVIIACLKEKGVQRKDLEDLPKRLSLPRGVTDHLAKSGILSKVGKKRTEDTRSLVYIYGPGCHYTAFMEHWL